MPQPLTLAEVLKDPMDSEEGERKEKPTRKSERKKTEKKKKIKPQQLLLVRVTAVKGVNLRQFRAAGALPYCRLGNTSSDWS